MRYLYIIVMLCLVVKGEAQQVGVNVTIPDVELDVRSIAEDDPSTFRISNPSKSRFLELFSGSATYPNPVILFPNNRNMLFATDQGGFSELMRIANSGNVGIGITNPLAQLDIKGGDWNLDAGNPGDLRIGNDTHNFRVGIATGGGGAGITRLYTSGNSMFLGTKNKPAIVIDQSENVGIGSYNPKGRLEVSCENLGDTLILLNNSNIRSSKNFGILLNDTNNQGTVGAYFRTDSIGVYSEISGNSGIAIEAKAENGNGIGLYSTAKVGVEARTYSETGFGVKAFNYSSTGSTVAVEGIANSPDGTGIKGIGAYNGVYGFASAANSNGIGIRGRATGAYSKGAEGVSIGTNGVGVYGDGETGVYARTSSTTGTAFYAFSSSSTGNTIAVDAVNNSPSGIGVKGVGPLYGVYGFSSAANSSGIGAYGRATGTDAHGVRGEAIGSHGKAVFAESTGDHGKGVHAKVSSQESDANAILAEWGGGFSYAGYFLGRVHVNGTLSKSSGSFKIDHPQDPENKYLYHSFVESPDMMNIYNGNITTNNKGYAVVKLPDYFEALNIEFRYQLTVIGEFAQVIVSEKIRDGKFTIRTDKPNVEVSWQVTGIRNDQFAKQNRIKVEVEKEDENKGKYLNPEVFGISSDLQIGGGSKSVKKECETDADLQSKTDY